MRQRNILGVRVDLDLTMEDVVSIIENRLLKDGKSHYLCTTNPEFIMKAQKDSDFRDIINNSDLSLPDGVGVLMADEYLGKTEKFSRDLLFPVRCLFTGLGVGLTYLVKGGKGKKRVSGVDLVYRLCGLSGEKKYSVFFLGGEKDEEKGESSVNASDKIIEKYPYANIVGASSGFFYSKEDDARSIDFLHSCMSRHSVTDLDLLFVAYGQGNQEKWIVRNSSKLPVRVSVGVGSTFNLIAGHNMNIRNKFKSWNLEWLARLLVEPKRIVRIFTAFPLFPTKVFFDSLKH